MTSSSEFSKCDNQTDCNLRATMHEIQCHPWVTYTEFPMYIDHKLTKDQTAELKKQRLKIPLSILQKLKANDHTSNYTNEHDLIEALRKNSNDSFVIEIRLQQNDSFERQREEKLARKRKEQSCSESISKPVFLFNLLSSVFSNKAITEKFKQSFYSYVLHQHNALNESPWRIGFSFSINLKRVLKNFFIVANKLNIKVCLIKHEDFKFKCSIYQNGEPTGRTFILQIFENIGEYVFDFHNENCFRIEFMVICFRLFKNK